MKFNTYFKSLKIMQFIDYIFKIFSYINLFSGSCKKKKVWPTTTNTYHHKELIMGVHGSVQVGFVPNPEPT